jgi:hypothetical protein
MALTISQLCKIFAATAVIGGAILPTSADARNELGSRAWDPGGGDFRWNYGGLSTCLYYYPAYYGGYYPGCYGGYVHRRPYYGYRRVPAPIYR